MKAKIGLICPVWANHPILRIVIVRLLKGTGPNLDRGPINFRYLEQKKNGDFIFIFSKNITDKIVTLVFAPKTFHTR